VDPWGTGQQSVDIMASGMGGPQVEVELVGPHLRVGGKISLGRFGRISDRVNHTRGFILMQDARLLKRNGDPTSLVVAELYVNQDEITFIAISHSGIDDQRDEGDDRDRPSIEKRARRYVVFTPGHSISGFLHVHADLTLANFVDSSEPRFIPMTAGTTRSLADRRVVSRFDLLLINRTQMTAIAVADKSIAGPEGPAVETG
jgi:hypothetical protein